MWRGSLKVVWHVVSSVRGLGGMARGARASLCGVVSFALEENVLIVIGCRMSGSEMEVGA